MKNRLAFARFGVRVEVSMLALKKATQAFPVVGAVLSVGWSGGCVNLLLV